MNTMDLPESGYHTSPRNSSMNPMYASGAMPSTPYKRARTRRTASGSSTVPKEVKSYVKSAIMRNIEIKERAYVDNFTVTNNTGLSLAYPAQGVTNQLRIGDEIRLQSVRVRGIMANVDAASTPRFFRMLVYMSRSQTLLPFTDLFYGVSATQVPAIVNPNYLKLLADKTWKFDVGNGLINSFDITIPLNNKKVTFDEGTIIPEQETIHIHFFQCDGAATPINNGVRVTYDAILRFRDA